MRIGETEVILKQGDITQEVVDVIVNAANTGLRGGGGVDGAIHRAGGPAIMKECNEIRSQEGGCRTGYSVLTGAGDLNAKYVAHAVGPVWHGGNDGEERQLRSAIQESLRRAAEVSARTIALPSISTGAYGYPIDQAAVVALSAVRDYLHEQSGFEEIRFVLFSDGDLAVYERTLEGVKAEEESR